MPKKLPKVGVDIPEPIVLSCDSCKTELALIVAGDEHPTGSTVCFTCIKALARYVEEDVHG